MCRPTGYLTHLTNSPYDLPTLSLVFPNTEFRYPNRASIPFKASQME